MKTLHRAFFIYFIIIFAIIMIIWTADKDKYSFFISENETRHSLVLDGTLVVFKNVPKKDLEVHDIIIMDTSNHSMARIMAIDNEKDVFEIAYDDFDTETVTVQQDAYKGVLVMHVNEIGKYYAKYLQKYQAWFMASPFIFIALSFVFASIHQLLIDAEDNDFEFCSALAEHYSLSKYGKTYYAGRNSKNNIINITYDTGIKTHMPDFHIPSIAKNS